MNNIIVLTPLPTPYVIAHFIERGIEKDSVYYTSAGSHRPNWIFNYHGNQLLTIRNKIEFLKKIIKARDVWVTSYGSIISLLAMYWAIILKKNLIIGPWELPYNESKFSFIKRSLLLLIPISFSTKKYACSLRAKHYFNSMCLSGSSFEILWYRAKIRLLPNHVGELKDRFTLLFSGALTSKRNPLIIIDAIEKLDLPIRKKLKIIFSGDGPLYGELVARTKRISDVDWVLDRCSDDLVIEKYYRSADCLVSLNIKNTWNMTVQEGMWYGNVIISSRTTESANDLVLSGHNGIFCDPNDSGQLAKTISTLVSDAKLVELLKGNAINSSRQQFHKLYVDQDEFNKFFDSNHKL